jgi:hypothetical protein
LSVLPRRFNRCDRDFGSYNPRPVGPLSTYWAKDVSIGNKLTSARSETAQSKLAFRDSFARRPSTQVRAITRHLPTRDDLCVRGRFRRRAG